MNAMMTRAFVKELRQAIPLFEHFKDWNDPNKFAVAVAALPPEGQRLIFNLVLVAPQLLRNHISDQMRQDLDDFAAETDAAVAKMPRDYFAEWRKTRHAAKT